MERFLEGRVAVVTGAGRPDGLGAAIGAMLAKRGAVVVISDVASGEDSGLARPDEFENVLAAIRAEGAPASAFPCDVRDWAAVHTLADHAVQAHGRLDIWINNAGVGYIMKGLMTVTPAEWRQVIDVNLTGAFFGLRAAADKMIAGGKGGRIVNVASQAAKSGFPDAEAYCSSKHGLVGLVRSAAIDLGPHGITVNNVCPNHVTTSLGAWQNAYFAERAGKTVPAYLAEMAARIPLGRPGLPGDTASAVAFLCSDEASYITAESLNVSGGEEPH